MTLKAVVSQQLIPTADGKGCALACEVMIVTPAIKNLIREGKTPMIQNAITTTAAEGAVTMDNALIKLAREKRISPALAIEHAHEQDFVKKNVGSIPIR
jgi:twitching motility protein PilT